MEFLHTPIPTLVQKSLAEFTFLARHLWHYFYFFTSGPDLGGDPAAGSLPNSSKPPIHLKGLGSTTQEIKYAYSFRD